MSGEQSALTGRQLIWFAVAGAGGGFIGSLILSAFLGWSWSSVAGAGTVLLLVFFGLGMYELHRFRTAKAGASREGASKR